MGFEVAIVGVGLARQQAFELALGGLGAQFFEASLGFGDDAAVALGLAQFDQLDRVPVVLLDALVAADQMVEPVALADQLLRRFGVVPELRVFGLPVQLTEATARGIPVKDASAAARAISGCRRPAIGSPRAWFCPS